MGEGFDPEDYIRNKDTIPYPCSAMGLTSVGGTYIYTRAVSLHSVLDRSNAVDRPSYTASQMLVPRTADDPYIAARISAVGQTPALGDQVRRRAESNGLLGQASLFFRSSGNMTHRAPAIGHLLPALMTPRNLQLFAGGAARQVTLKAPFMSITEASRQLATGTQMAPLFFIPNGLDAGSELAILSGICQYLGYSQTLNTTATEFTVPFIVVSDIAVNVTEKTYALGLSGGNATIRVLNTEIPLGNVTFGAILNTLSLRDCAFLMYFYASTIVGVAYAGLTHLSVPLYDVTDAICGYYEVQSQVFPPWSQNNAIALAYDFAHIYTAHADFLLSLTYEIMVADSLAPNFRAMTAFPRLNTHGAIDFLNRQRIPWELLQLCGFNITLFDSTGGTTDMRGRRHAPIGVKVRSSYINSSSSVSYATKYDEPAPAALGSALFFNCRPTNFTGRSSRGPADYAGLTFVPANLLQPFLRDVGNIILETFVMHDPK